MKVWLIGTQSGLNTVQTTEGTTNEKNRFDTVSIVRTCLR